MRCHMTCTLHYTSAFVLLVRPYRDAGNVTEYTAYHFVRQQQLLSRKPRGLGLPQRTFGMVTLCTLCIMTACHCYSVCELS
jgi:hypothetical protein